LLADHGDRVLYANSVEGRYPFLDINVIECAKTLPPHLLVRDMEEKYILKRIAERYLPSSVIKREKFGFVAPASPFLIQQNIEWVNDLLSSETIRRMGYFNPDTVERLRQTYSEPGFNLSQTYEDDFLMIVLTFNLFAELFEIPNFH
jgi:asparagine synthase (glutamine-hydrolysing)